jgi:hypothetical protein
LPKNDQEAGIIKIDKGRKKRADDVSDDDYWDP